jgi:hypothetical protein
VNPSAGCASTYRFGYGGRDERRNVFDFADTIDGFAAARRNTNDMVSLFYQMAHDVDVLPGEVLVDEKPIHFRRSR